MNDTNAQSPKRPSRGLIQRFRTFRALPTQSLFLSAFFTLAALAQNVRDPKTIYGLDDRIDTYAAPLRQQQWAAAVCGIVDATRLVTNAQNGTVSLVTSPWRVAGYPPCADEPFRNQPIAPFCSAFLVSSNVIVTAGHCIESECELDQFGFVFEFEMLDASTARTSFPLADVYSGVELIARERVGNTDYAMIRLDRPVSPDRIPLQIRAGGSTLSGTPVGVIGHPSGLPKKVAFGSTTRVGTTYSTSFAINTDTYGGNSGSPIINAENGLVEGILIKGRSDYEFAGACFYSVRYADSLAGEIATKSQALPQSLIFSRAIPANDDFADGIRLSGSCITLTGVITHASAEVGEPRHGSDRSRKSVWWSWTSPANGNVVVSTAGTYFDHYLAVYTGASLSMLLPVRKGVGSAGSGATLIFAVSAGITYHIAVDGPCGAAGRVVLDLAADFAQIALGVTNITSATSGSSVPVDIRACRGMAWHVVNTNGWLTVDRTSGVGQATLRLTIPLNDTHEDRTGTLLVNGMALAVEQRGDPLDSLKRELERILNDPIQMVPEGRCRRDAETAKRMLGARDRTFQADAKALLFVAMHLAKTRCLPDLDGPFIAAVLESEWNLYQQIGFGITNVSPETAAGRRHLKAAEVAWREIFSSPIIAVQARRLRNAARHLDLAQ